ncbi:unnamed protein product [Rotaria magnacalcarata]|uniref:Uncharacterized protein n=1 Tax=Rotaria magnacalcarata TaxID=392030 RepID=A0A816R9B9_9BILA|nr:unnamed protein product [Rotaria magnacalcarata]CAF4038065.1 unnamed protein product [Rotaria magnacalcarata]
MSDSCIKQQPYLVQDRVKNLTLPDHTICSLCRGILWKPVACQTCETPFCSSCIKSWQIETSEPTRCPANCSKYIQRKCPRAITSILSNLQTICRYKQNGCTKIVPYSDLQTHEETCDHRLITCSGCQKEVVKKDFQDHHSKCQLVLLRCPECAAVYQRQDEGSHTETVCLRVRLHQLQNQSKQHEAVWNTVAMRRNSDRTLGETDLHLIRNFLIDYDKSVTWQLTHKQNITRILQPKLEIFFTQLGCNADIDKDRRIQDLLTKYRKVLTIWKTHYKNIFEGLQPLLREAVLDIRDASYSGSR